MPQPPAAGPRRLRSRLEHETSAEVHFDRGLRGLYATDASLYQIEPVGVIVPTGVRRSNRPASSVMATAMRGCAAPPVPPPSGMNVTVAPFNDVNVRLALKHAIDRNAIVERNLPLVATNPAAYTDPSFHAAHDAMLCIAHSAYLESAERVTSSPEAWLKDAATVAELFADLSTAGLINEYRFLVTPTVLGRGKSLFSALETRLRLKLLRATPSSGGGMLMEYEPKT